MNSKTQGFKSKMTSTYVLEHNSPDDVARAMIESGQQEEPFYIFNMDEACHRVHHFKKMMPRVKIFYAMKSNDTDLMLRLMAAAGLGFDCSSPGEIYKIRQLGVDPRKIIYASPCKRPGAMKYAREMGVRYTTFDSLCELHKMRKSWPDAMLLIRIRIESKAKIQLGLKFGCDFETEAISLLDQAASFGLKVVGVAFHVGSLCYSPESYLLGLRYARALFDHEAKNGRRMNFVDIGGGYLSNRSDSIDELSYLINDSLKELFPDPAVQVFAEPGGYLCDSAFKLFCSVAGTRKVIRNNVNMIYLNDGIHGALRFDENWHTLCKFQKSSEIDTDIEEETIIWGPTCNSLDCLMPNGKIKFPRCSVDDWLTVDNHGAYTLVLSSMFSSTDENKELWCASPVHIAHPTSLFSSVFSSMKIPLIRSVVTKKLWSSLNSPPFFQPSDFILNPDISSLLSSTLPPVLPTPTREIYENSEIPN